MWFTKEDLKGLRRQIGFDFLFISFSLFSFMRVLRSKSWSASSRFHCFYVLLLFSFYLVCRKDNMKKRFSRVTWQHTTVGSSLTTPQWNWVSWIPWQTTEIQRQTVFTKQFTMPGIQNHIKKMTRATAQLFQSLVWRTPHHVHDLDHKKHFGVLFLTWQRQKKKSFCFFLWEKELYSTRITSRCCSAFQQTRKL